MYYVSFNSEVVTNIRWSKEKAESRIAVSGSKGTVAILRVDLVSGHAILEKEFVKMNAFSMDWA